MVILEHDIESFAEQIIISSHLFLFKVGTYSIVFLRRTAMYENINKPIPVNKWQGDKHTQLYDGFLHSFRLSNIVTRHSSAQGYNKRHISRSPRSGTEPRTLWLRAKPQPDILMV